MKYAHFKSRFIWILSLLSIACITATAVLFFRLSAGKQVFLDTAKASAEKEAKKATTIIDKALAKVVKVNDAISQALTSGELKKEDIKARLVEEMNANTFLTGVGVAYTPYSYSPDLRLYAPLYVKRDTEPQMVQIEDSYDYTEATRDWYHLPLKLGPVWQEPHFGQATNHYIANYTAPIFSPDAPDGDPIGVVFTSMSLEQYQELVLSLDLGDTGYGFILSKKGAFVAHPIDNYVLKGKTIFELAEEVNDKTLANLGQQAIEGQAHFVDYKNELTGESAWVFLEPIPSTGWSLAVAFYNGNLLDIPKFQKMHFRIGLLISISALLLFTLFIAKLPGIEKTLHEAWLAVG